ncbi:MAG: NAD(P)-dependent alcohol dehydrogenase [Acidimicrobiales bacterium]
MTNLARAAVLREAGKPLALEEIELDTPRPFEVLVRMESVGVCRTDTHALHDTPPPAILGHEGAGTVAAVGSSVTKVTPGDKVLTTFATCGTCRRCRLGQVAYCDRFIELNFTGRRSDGTTAARAGGEPIATHFLGQSCFATHALVGERSVVPVDPSWDLRPLGPFGCGFQTGAGAVVNTLRPPAGSSIAVCGAGAVGLAAIAAAALAGCGPIVAVDTAAGRLDTAVRFGATDTVDAGTVDMAEALAGLVPDGLDYAIDTTGVADVVRRAVAALNTRGTCGIVGAGASTDVVLDWRTVLNGRTVTGVIAGDSVPDLFLPELIGLHHAGRFPVDELIEYFPFEDINEAIAASVSGTVVKPVLTF